MKCDAEYYNCIRMLVSLLGNHASTRINFELLTSSVHDVKSLDSMQGSISREQLMVWKKQAPQERPACVPLSAVLQNQNSKIVTQACHALSCDLCLNLDRHELPREPAAILSKRHRAVHDQPAGSAYAGLGSWKQSFMCLIETARRHPDSCARSAAFKGIQRVINCILSSNSASAHSWLPSDLAALTYHTASFCGLQDLSVEVRLQSCHLVASTALILGKASMTLPLKKASASRSTTRDHEALLQFGQPLSTADHAFQSLCGMLLDTYLPARVAALKGLQSIATACSVRVKLQACSKKTTFMVRFDRIAAGCEADERLLEDAVGAFIHASEDCEDQVRQALAELLSVIPINDDNGVRESSTELTQHALDFLVDLMHDEAVAVSAAAAEGLLALRESVKVLPWDPDHVSGILSCMDSSESSVRSAVRTLIDSGSISLPSR